MKDSNEKAIEQFLAKGGQIEKLPPGGELPKPTISRVKLTAMDLMTLGEASDLLGEAKALKEKPKKTIDLSDINRDLIPKNLWYILDSFNSKEEEEE